MSHQQDDKDLLQKVSQKLDESEQALPAEVVSRLRQSRQQALEQHDRKPLFSWRPLGAVATAMSVLVIMIGFTFMQPDSTGNIDSLSDLSLLSATEEFELYEELDFYQWLEFEEHAG